MGAIRTSALHAALPLKHMYNVDCRSKRSRPFSKNPQISPRQVRQKGPNKRHRRSVDRDPPSRAATHSKACDGPHHPNKRNNQNATTVRPTNRTREKENEKERAQAASASDKKDRRSKKGGKKQKTTGIRHGVSAATMLPLFFPTIFGKSVDGGRVVPRVSGQGSRWSFR